MSRNCFWGRPCDCFDCRPELEEKCEVCKEKDGSSVGGILKTDRKGISYYDFKTYCSECYEKHIGKYDRAYFQMLKAKVQEDMKNAPLFRERIFLSDGSSIPYGYKRSKKEEGEKQNN